MYALLASIEQTPYSVWVREAPTLWAFPFLLILHAIGMGLVAGLHMAMCLRVAGLAAAIPLPGMRAFFPWLWLGLAVNVFSGFSLLWAYPAKALTNPLFYLKLALIGVALWGLRWMRAHAFAETPPAAARRVAWLSAAAWLAAIFAGRWLAYTYTRLMAGD